MKVRILKKKKVDIKLGEYPKCLLNGLPANELDKWIYQAIFRLKKSIEELERRQFQYGYKGDENSVIPSKWWEVEEVEEERNCDHLDKVAKELYKCYGDSFCRDCGLKLKEITMRNKL